MWHWKWQVKSKLQELIRATQLDCCAPWQAIKHTHTHTEDEKAAAVQLYVADLKKWQDVAQVKLQDAQQHSHKLQPVW